jgi:hypothetical protein
MIHNRSRGARKATILQLSKGPTGVAGADVPQASVDFLYKLCRDGELFTRRTANGRVPKRYFDSQERADAYYEQLGKKPRPKHPPKPKTESVTPVHFKSARAVPGGPARMDGEPVITPHTKFTVAPPPAARVWRTNTHSNY